MPTLDRAQLEAIVDAVCARLDGDWLVIGGAIAALWFEPRRTTEDVDIMGMQGRASDRMELFALAEQLELPIEVLNSAADFFVQRVADWRDHVVVFRQGARGRVFRPSATLFLVLKSRRLDERDLADCRALLATGEAFDRDRVLAALDRLPPARDPELAARRAELRALVTGA